MKLSTRLLTGIFILFISIFLSMPALAEDADADADSDSEPTKLTPTVGRPISRTP